MNILIIKILILYLLIISFIGYWSMRNDKRKAITHSRRTPEKTLFLYALLGGSVGSMAGMAVFRHKTRHLSFKLGMPLILIMQIVLIYLVGKYLV